MCRVFARISIRTQCCTPTELRVPVGDGFRFRVRIIQAYVLSFSLNENLMIVLPKGSRIIREIREILHQKFYRFVFMCDELLDRAILHGLVRKYFNLYRHLCL